MVVMQAVEARPGVVGKWWYEIHRDDGEYSIEQQSTFSPACICDDGVNHWMGSMHGRRGRAGVVREAACWLVTVKPRAAAAAFASSMMPSSSSVTKVAVPTSTWTSLTPSTPPSAPVSGVILLAPMLAIDVNEPSRFLLKALSYVAPTLAVIPSSSTSSERQYRDPDKRKECEDDELSISGSTIRIGSASTCVELAKNIRSDFSSISCPFICMIGIEDVVVDNAGARDLMEKAPSPDKTLKEYPALHGLLCEPSPLVDEIHSDLLSWLNKRTS